MVVDTTSGTISGLSGLVSTGSIGVDPGDPWIFDNASTGVQLRGIGGTWTPDAPLIIDSRNSGQTTSIGAQGDCPPDAAPYPDPPPTPFTFLAPVNNFMGICINQDTFEPELFDHFTEPLSYMDIGSSTSGVLYNMTQVGMDFLGGGVISHYGTYLDIVGQSIQSRIRSGGLRTDAGHVDVYGGNIWCYDGSMMAGAPTDATLAYGSPESINGEHGLFWGDVHAQDTVYGREHVVVGMGRQKFGPTGSLNVSTQGTGIVPYGGSARLSVTSDQQGAYYSLLTSTAPYRGLIGNAHRFDTDILTSGSINTSGTISENSNHVPNVTEILAGTGITVTPSVSNVTISGSQEVPVSSIKTSNYTILSTDAFIRTSGTLTLALPTAVGITGQFYVIKQLGVGTVTIDGNGTETIDGSLTDSLLVLNAVRHLISDGANWLVW